MKKEYMPELISGDAEDWKFYDRLDYVVMSEIVKINNKF